MKPWLVLVGLSLVLTGCTLFNRGALASIDCAFPDAPMTLAPNWVCGRLPPGALVSSVASASLVDGRSPAQEQTEQQALARIAEPLTEFVLRHFERLSGFEEVDRLLNPEQRERIRLLVASYPLPDVSQLGSRRSPNNRLYLVYGIQSWQYQDWLPGFLAQLMLEPEPWANWLKGRDSAALAQDMLALI